MNKIAVFVMAACILLTLSLQLPAPPPAQTSRAFEITIEVADSESGRTISMGEKYAYAVPQEATIKWKCKLRFKVEFEGDAPFELAEPGAPIPDFNVIAKKARADAQPNHLYKYTVFVVDSNGDPLTLDPIIVIIPPDRDR